MHPGKTQLMQMVGKCGDTNAIMFIAFPVQTPAQTYTNMN